MNRLRQLVRTDATHDRFLPTIKKALPFRIDPEGATEAVLMLHGLTGNPSELVTLGKALADAGYAVYAPRHPGHGTSRSDLMKSDASDWVRNSLDAYLDLKADYQTIHVLGHSMGGLLATTVAMVFDAPKLMLLAPAFLLSTNKVPWTIFESHFRKFRVRNRPMAEGSDNSEYQNRMHTEYWSDELILPVANLFRLSMRVKKEIKRLRSRTLVIVGEKDPVVPPSTAPLIARIAVNAASVDTVELKDAGHLFSFDERVNETARLVVDWIGKPVNKKP